MTTRERVKRLIDKLPEDVLGAAQEYLEFLQYRSDPLLRALLSAPEEDEPISPEEEAAVEEGRQALARGEVITDDELRRKLGF